MEINNPKFNTLEEQVQTNMQNIQVLANEIKPVFNATVELTPQTTTIDASNVRDWVVGTTDGFILDNTGYLFKIVAVSDNTIYVQYWSDLEGPQGIQGPQGEQGEQGNRGTRITAGMVPPIETVAIPNDLWIDTYNNSYNLNQRNSSNTSWTKIGNIKGADGEQGIGFNNLTSMNLVTGDPTSVTYNAEDGIIVQSQGNFTADGTTYTATVENKVPIKGSETIVLDATEDGKAVEAHLDANIVSTISRAMVTPLASPASNQLVSIDTQGMQNNLNIGDGLTIDTETNTISASGVGSKSYLHSITVRQGNDIVKFELINNRNTQYASLEEIGTELQRQGYTGGDQNKIATGISGNSKVARGYYAVWYTGGNIKCGYYEISFLTTTLGEQNVIYDITYTTTSANATTLSTDVVNPL